MVLESKTASPRWRQNSINSPPFKKQHARLDELGSFSTLVHRHRFLLTAFVLLTVLCTIYLYLAVTFGANNSCSRLSVISLSFWAEVHYNLIYPEGDMPSLVSTKKKKRWSSQCEHLDLQDDDC